MQGRFEGLLSRRLGGFVIAAVTTIAATGMIEVIPRAAQVPNISLLYLPPILLTAIYFGTTTALAASALAVAEYDYFLLNPRFTLTVNRVQDGLALAVFSGVAVVTSQLAASARARAEAARLRARESATLQALSQAVMFAEDTGDMLERMAELVTDMFRAKSCAIFVPGEDGNLILAAHAGQQRAGVRASSAAAAYAYRQGNEVSIPGSDVPLGKHDVSSDYVPLRVADTVVGVMEIAWSSRDVMSPEDARLLQSFCVQGALLIERARSEEESRRIQLLEDADRVKSALLSAVSHDLRTPLALIKTSVTSLLLGEEAWPPTERDELLQAINTESDRLNHLVGNLLDVSRIEAGALHPLLDWYEAGEVIETAVAQCAAQLRGRVVNTRVERGLLPARLDLVLIAQALSNLLENAARYSNAESSIDIATHSSTNMLLFSVADHGPGVSFEQRDRIFNRFVRSKRHDDSDHGVGLGLAICRGIAQIHGGRVEVRQTEGGGATFVLSLPHVVPATAPVDLVAT